MEPASPARLYATLVGAILFVGGIVGFFFDLSWVNYLYVTSGAIGLFLAGFAARPYALGAGAIYTGLAIWEFSDRGWEHLALGLLGLAAFAATHSQFRGSKSTNRVGKEPRKRSTRLKARAKAAAKGA